MDARQGKRQRWTPGSAPGHHGPPRVQGRAQTADTGETRNDTVFVVTLYTPAYDAERRTLTYPVRVVPDGIGRNESIVAWYRRVRSGDKNLPTVRSLTEGRWPRLVLRDAALFIDDWSSMENSAFCDDCCAVSCYMNSGTMWGLGGGFW